MRLLILALLFLAGCTFVDQERLADGSYRLRYEHGFNTPQSAAATALHMEAGKDCPNGYRKTDERASGGYMDGATEWTIRCD